MDGGEDIGIGVDPVELHYHLGQKIASLYLRAQILSVGDQQPDGHAEEKGQRQIAHVPPERSAVPEQQVQPQPDEQWIPQTVRNQGVLAERNAVVHRQLGGPVAGGDQMLRQGVGQQIGREPQSVLQLPQGGGGRQTHNGHLTDLGKSVSLR